MDDRRFDAFARRLASASNRRQVLRGLLGFGGAMAATSARSSRGGSAPGADTEASLLPRRANLDWQRLHLPGRQSEVRAGVLRSRGLRML